MLNQVVVVGRIVQNPEIKETEKGKVSNITLAVPRSYKNEEGEYETDFVDCALWKGVAESTVDYCRKGDLVGIKGRLETSTYKNDANELKKSVRVIAEKVTFLATRDREREKEEELS